MNYFCTQADQDRLAHGLALHHSLQTHAGDFELVVLCLDEATATGLQARALPRVRLLLVAELMEKHPALSAARADRSDEEFKLTCKSWLVRHCLGQVPARELLTYLDASQFFFSSPQPVYDQIGEASVAIVPFRYSANFVDHARRGQFSTGWISFRHDSTGLACAAAWADECAAWCFTLLETSRYAEQKYLEQWPTRHAGTVILDLPGLDAAPWNIADAQLIATDQGPLINDRTLICYNFSGVTHLTLRLYDPGLQKFDVAPSTALRTHVYLPYLHQLTKTEGSSGPRPDIVPPGNTADPRCGNALVLLTERWRAAEREQSACRRALERNRASAQAVLDGIRAELSSTVLFLHEMETDRNEQRQALVVHQNKLKSAYSDLERNVACLKDLETEMAALASDKDAQIASLSEQLARSAGPAAAVEQADFLAVLEPYARQIRRLVVVHYHPRLLPEILWLSLQGVSVEVWGSPPEFVEAARGPVAFRKETLWERLGQINSLFSEQAYLLAHPDVGSAVARGELPSGWHHYLLFGQREGRVSGTPEYNTGLAEFDAVAFDGCDAARLVPGLIGRLQAHQKFFISGFTPPTDWLPPGEGRSYLLGHTLYCEQPPVSWLGPCLPTNELSRHLPAPTPAAIYPPTPAQKAEWPLISVVTVNDNQGAYLEETIRSVLDQNYPNLEYIIVDGGSIDGTVEIIQKYASRLKWWVSEKDRGQAHALNKGFGKSSGQILTWLNSGDRLAPGSLYLVGQTFLLHAADVVAGRCALVNDREPVPHLLHRSSLPLGQLEKLRLDQLLELDGCWRQGWFFHQPEVFFTRTIFDRAGGSLHEDLAYSIDYDLWVRLAKAGAQIFTIPEILAILREHPTQETGGRPEHRLTELRTVNAAHRSSL
ncbi:MAG: glycosyltransferase [Candidatus Didemnitutus sp.]|nr:glycosyltransferase [Candidatus Didemnitutus sp.]